MTHLKDTDSELDELLESLVQTVTGGKVNMSRHTSGTVPAEALLTAKNKLLIWRDRYAAEQVREARIDELENLLTGDIDVFDGQRINAVTGRVEFRKERIVYADKIENRLAQLNADTQKEDVNET